MSAGTVTARLYVNGTQEATTTYASAGVTRRANTSSLSGGTSGTDMWDGSLCNVVAHQKALTAAQVSGLRAAGRGTTPTCQSQVLSHRQGCRAVHGDDHRWRIRHVCSTRRAPPPLIPSRAVRRGGDCAVVGDTRRHRRYGAKNDALEPDSCPRSPRRLSKPTQGSPRTMRFLINKAVISPP